MTVPRWMSDDDVKSTLKRAQVAKIAKFVERELVLARHDRMQATEPLSWQSSADTVELLEATMNALSVAIREANERRAEANRP